MPRRYLCIFLLLTGCLTTTVKLASKDDELMYEQSKDFYLWGLTPSVEISSAELCGKHRQLTVIETQKTGLEVLVTTLTIGLYSPKTLRAWCSDETH